MENGSLFKRIYLDNSATTQTAAEVMAAMLPYFGEQFGNASSIHSFGQQAKAAIDRARRQVATLLNAEINEIVFVSGGTEADNLAIRGIAAGYRDKGNHIITSQFEHPAVINTCAALEKQGWRVTYLPVYENGLVRIEDLRAALTDETLLITIMHANNEVGTLQPIAEIGQLVKELRAQRKYLFFHTDAVQSVGKAPVDVKAMGVDLLSLSGHKIHAPKGIGALFVRKGVRLGAQLTGGRHERERRGHGKCSCHCCAGRSCRTGAHQFDELCSNARTTRLFGAGDRAAHPRYQIQRRSRASSAQYRQYQFQLY
jgi:cysteine desulfurase